jgi:hypothetical protein
MGEGWGEGAPRRSKTDIPAVTQLTADGAGAAYNGGKEGARPGRLRMRSGASKAIVQVIERASVDATFRELLKSNPDQALAAYPLTDAERAAVLRADPRPLRSLELERRTPKKHHHPIEPTDPYPNPASAEG